MIVFDVNQHGWLLRNSRIDRSYVQYVSETKKKKKERKGDRNISNTACATTKCSLYRYIPLFAFANYCKWRNISRCSSFLCFWKVTDKLKTNFWFNLHISKYVSFFLQFICRLSYKFFWNIIYSIEWFNFWRKLT